MESVWGVDHGPEVVSKIRVPKNPLSTREVMGHADASRWRNYWAGRNDEAVFDAKMKGKSDPQSLRRSETEGRFSDDRLSATHSEARKLRRNSLIAGGAAGGSVGAGGTYAFNRKKKK